MDVSTGEACEKHRAEMNFTTHATGDVGYIFFLK